MEGFTIVDGVVAIVIVVSALLAYSRGFVREAMAIAGWIGATILAFIFADSLGGLDQGFGFLFGVLRGILLVAVAFFVYQTVLSTQKVDMVENSRSATVFGKLTGQIEDRDPEAALGWITTQYKQLVGTCGAAPE